jgi:hypothetical protein
VWSATGEALTRSSHHHGAVRCVLVQPSLPGGKAVVWTGGADGVVYAWTDGKRDMLVNAAAEGRAYKVQGSNAVGVASLCPVQTPRGLEMWAGYDNGVIRAWSSKVLPHSLSRRLNHQPFDSSL